jgi:hypothetical protein
MLSKKYFSITEASDMRALAAHKLRYIDKTDQNISIVKIRGRRYYTMDNIEYLVEKYSDIDLPIINKTFQPSSDTQTDHQFRARIDQLLNNFNDLAKHLS